MTFVISPVDMHVWHKQHSLGSVTQPSRAKSESEWFMIKTVSVSAQCAMAQHHQINIS